MKDELVSILYKAARDVVEAIGDQAFVDYGEVANADTKARMDQLRYAVRVIQSNIPKYREPFVVTFVDDDHSGTKAFKTEDEAGWAVVSYLEHRGGGQNGVHAAYYHDRRQLWE